MIEQLLSKLQDPGWLLGSDNPRLAQSLLAVEQQLQQIQTPILPRRLLIQERDPVAILAAVLGGYRAGYSLFFADPSWGQRECAQALAAMQAGYHLQAGQLKICAGDWDPIASEHRWFLIPTGGSSGQVRYAIHTRDTLRASVLGFQSFLQVEAINSLCLLPLHHVSGLMQAMRALFTGGRVRIQTWKTIEQGHFPPDPSPNSSDAQSCLSLVPTQLHRLLGSQSQASPEATLDWLRSFQIVLLGGAPSWASLRQQSRHDGIPLGLTYGMTETASQIATLPPSAFWAGEEDYLPLLPHAHVQIMPVPGHSDGPEYSDGVGQIQIQAQSLALGYYPQLWDPAAPLVTDDLGQVNTAGDLRILGRRQDLIISGGEKILAPEVEAELRALPGILDVCVMGIPDPEWGERVAAVYVPQLESTDLASLDPEQASQMLKSQLRERLHPAKIPKTWHRVAQLPRNPQGKLNRDQIRQLLGGEGS